MEILTLNCGSSSLKYQLYDWDNGRVVASGIVERVTQPGSKIEHATSGKEELVREQDCPTHAEAIELILEALTDPTYGAINTIDQIKAVGHRVVHGGERFSRSVLVTPEIIEAFRELAHLAPLHNPANITGIEAARKVLPEVPHAAIMDTAWHQTMPQHAYLYALPHSWYQEHGVRRYGFHGTSFLYTAKRAAVLLEKDPFETNLIIAHIGNGSSICAVKNGVSVDTSMGMTPLEGLIMGTRSGDTDPAIPFYMINETGMTSKEVESALNKQSGVLGITEKFVDRRDIEIAAEQGDERAQLAIDMEAYRIRKYVGSYAAVLGSTDAIVFTAGVGERGPIIRQKALEGLESMGIIIDQQRNFASMTKNAETEISAPDSPVKVFVIPTDEELVMTEDTYALIDGTYKEHTEYRYRFQDPAYINADRKAKLPKDLKKWQGLDTTLTKPWR
ncbi:acetate kinase [Spirochaeta africana]|uniref:Acetate kinase n=1 Tax=Spirochaeta africana (strain ATCC 700263 / DSM 8902 / Z-7692) TaxID=889378 RepID=H9ULY5_SPIAZ|nr:acetate kinase [Spirochaeta africana]AFG38528.1 acetate kinase [Spirochaeta africana DSM 8902]